MKSIGRLPALIVLCIIVALGFVGFKLSRQHPIDTDILSLLPAEQRNPVLADALTRLSAVASSRIAILIEGGTTAERSDALADLNSALAASGIFHANAEDAHNLWEWMFSHRTRLVCPADREALENGHGQALAHDALLQWYSPFGISNSALLKSDPLLLTPRLMNCLLGQYVSSGQIGNVSLVSGNLTESAFRVDIQDRLNTIIEQWKEHWSASGLSLYRAGAVFHAAYGAEGARWQMSIISTVTIILILAIYILIFGTVRPAFIAVLLVGSCLAVGLAVAFAAFYKIHLMVIVFATALIGMAVDYSTYYLITGIAKPDESSGKRCRSIFRPLTLGMITSVGAFAALLFAPIPAFRQIAILGGAGLFFAWASALFLLPSLEGKNPARTRTADWAQRLVNRCLGRTPRISTTGIIVLAIAALGAIAWMKGGTLDDVRRFQVPSAALAAEEAHIRSATGFTAAGSFFLVTGTSADEAKNHEEVLLKKIRTMSLSKDIVAIAASAFDPSQSTTQRQNELLRQRLLDPYLRDVVNVLGSASATAYNGAETTTSSPPDLISALRGQTGITFWSIVPIAVPVADIPQELATGPFWTLTDPATSYSRLLAEFRWIASVGLAVGTFITGVILLVVYREIVSLWILLPTALAMVATPSILSLLGLPYSFFSAMGLFLVVGAGVDYSIFQWEHAESRGRWTRLGITLAALMTSTSIGLLGFSSVLPVASFGVTVALGILLSLALSPIATIGRSRRSK